MNLMPGVPQNPDQDKAVIFNEQLKLKEKFGVWNINFYLQQFVDNSIEGCQ